GRGKGKEGGRRDPKGPVHYPARPILVGQRAAVNAEDGGGHAIGRANHAGRGDVEVIDTDEIARQPQGEGDERAEDEEIVEREAPALDALERLEHGAKRRRLTTAASPRL